MGRFDRESPAMHVRDAVASRYSCRAFLPTPIPEQIVRDIVELSARAPSAGNMQPWRIDVIAGERVEALKNLLRPRMNELPRAEGTEYTIYPPEMNATYRKRRFEVGDCSTGRSGCRARTSRRATGNTRRTSNFSAHPSASSFRSTATSVSPSILILAV